MNVGTKAGSRCLGVFILILCASAFAPLFYLNPVYAMDVTLAWDANTETNLAGYKVYYGTVAGGPYRGSGSDEGASPILVPLSRLVNVGSPEFTVHGLPDVTCSFVVTAYNTEGLESGYSNEATAQAPTAPPPFTENAFPVLSSLEVNGQRGSTTVYTNNRNVTVRIVASDDTLVSQYLILDGRSDPSGEVFHTLPGGPRQNPIFIVNDFVLNENDGNHTIYAWVKDGQGLISPTVTKTNVILERTQAIAGFPVLNYGDGSITISYSESNMRNAALASNYSLNNGLLLSGNGVDVSGINRTFRFPLNAATLQRYIIYTLQIGSDITDSAGNAVTPSTIRVNDDDNDGMADDWEILYFADIEVKSGAQDTDGDGMLDRFEYSYARQKPGQWPSWWRLDPTKGDSDGDGIPDKYEVDQGLNPTDASDRNLDLDGDGWSNYEEYLHGYSANNANSPVPAPPQVREVIPSGRGPVPNNSSFAVRLEATQGIDITQSSGVALTINDGTRTYRRNLNSTNASGAEIVKAIPLSSGATAVRDLWIAYYRGNETAMPNLFPSGVTVQITVEATDVRNARMSPRSFSFRIQTDAEEEEEGERLPHFVTLTDDPAPGLTTSRVVDATSGLHGAAIIYASSLPSETGVVPYVGPADAVPNPRIAGHTGVGLAMNLLPPSVFPDGVTLLIPSPGYTDVGGLSVFYHNGTSWVIACDPSGNVQPGGAGWMVPGSRVNHNGNPSYIEIKVYHFSAVIAATTSGTTVVVESGGGGGGGCFISSIME